MAQATAKEIRGKTPDENRARIADLKKEAFNLRFQGATGDLENRSRIRLVRREIARIKTVMNENTAGKAKAGAKAKADAKPASTGKTKSRAKPKAKAGSKKGKAQ